MIKKAPGKTPGKTAVYEQAEQDDISIQAKPAVHNDRV